LEECVTTGFPDHFDHVLRKRWRRHGGRIDVDVRWLFDRAHGKRNEMIAAITLVFVSVRSFWNVMPACFLRLGS
jgi:hypothetical protein